MLNFKKFFTEAKVSESKLEKVVDIFLRLIKRKLSTSEFFRFGGPKGAVEIAGGKGLLYFYNKSKAIRFNYVGGEIASISLWNSFKLGQSADYTVDLSSLGLMQSSKLLMKIMDNPKVGSFEITPNPFLKESYEGEKESLIVEATRIRPAEFLELAQNSFLPDDEDITSLSWETISDIAAESGFQVPGAVRSTRVAGTKGIRSRFDLTKLASSKKSGSEASHRVTVSKGDKQTRGFTSVNGSKGISGMASTAKQAIVDPNVKEEMKNPDSLFGIMKNLVQLVARKSRNSLVIYGGPGTGKTYTVTETLKSEGMKKGEDYIIVKGKITTAALYNMLFLHRHGSMLVFDDTDSVWGDADAANLLKAALDSYDERTISWVTNRTINVSRMTDQQKLDFADQVESDLIAEPGNKKIKLPSEFLFNGRIIFISNLTYEKFDSAVLTRSAKIDMSLTDEQMFFRIKSVLPHLGDPNVDINVKEDILEFIKGQNASGALKEPSMRTFVAAEDTYKSGLPNWKDLLAYL